MKMNSPRRIRNNRAKWLLGFFLTVMVILIGRLAYVQIFDHARYVALAKNEVEKNEELYSPRGTIYDRNGNQLAISVMVKSLYCDPATLNKQKNINGRNTFSNFEYIGGRTFKKIFTRGTICLD